MSARRGTHCGNCNRSKAAEPEQFRLVRREAGGDLRMAHRCRPCEAAYDKEWRAKQAARDTGKCSIDGCAAKGYVKDMCRPHYDKQRRDSGPRCVVEGCNYPRNTKGFCNTHHYRYRTYGDPGTAELWRAPSGSGHTNPQGYRRIWVEGVNVAEHRYIMEQILGRRLWADENVHHINGVRDDNRPENLELWSKGQPCGQRVQDKVAWAKEMLHRYLTPEELRAWMEKVAA
jgi:hypothetical protein